VDSEASAIELAESLRKRLSTPTDIDGRHIDLSASIGVAWINDPTLEVDALVDAADSAMYESKRAHAEVASRESVTIGAGSN
jgi:GGDEF domain-containing protein